MISLHDINGLLIEAYRSSRAEVFGEAERQYRRGVYVGILRAYCTLTGEQPEDIDADLREGAKVG